MGIAQRHRSPGRGQIRYCRPGRYEVWVPSTERGHKRGERAGVYETKFRAIQAADAWFAAQQQRKAG